MSNHIRQQLIKMGNTNPDLRPHIRPILASMPKEAREDAKRKAMLDFIWKKTHRDSKGKFDGAKSVLGLGSNGATTIIILDQLSDAELLALAIKKGFKES
jgi:hypothetical protein